jgi:hypothetical protein
MTKDVTNPKKHVIFLGAGASAASGYPMANDLRLCLTSQRHFVKLWTRNTNQTDWSLPQKYFEERKEAVDYFRKGGFSTVDEFCQLANDSNDEVAQDYGGAIRQLTGAVLSCVNPEKRFHKSEYYPFIQRLFKDDLCSLRDDIAVLSFNYDPYLEYLLLRAYKIRQEVRGSDPNQSVRQGSEKETAIMNAITSGFYKIGSDSWISDKGFCLLKLHGAICLPNPDFQPFSYEDLFEGDANVRSRIFSSQNPASPIVFPWELFKGGPTLRSGFCEQFPSIADNTRRVWQRAQREVASAAKISFVGLSLHSYLEFGLKNLFQNFEGEVQIVVANPDTVDSGHKGFVRPWTSAGKLVAVLKRIAPNLKRLEVRSATPLARSALLGSSTVGPTITLRNSFEEFIRREMDPLESLDSERERLWNEIGLEA